jgi:hypothetical protein
MQKCKNENLSLSKTISTKETNKEKDDKTKKKITQKIHVLNENEP